MGSQPKDPELLEIPGAEGVSVDYFTDLMNKPAPTKEVPLLNVGPAQQIPGLNVGEAMKVPLQQIAGLTGNEKIVQSLLSKFLGTDATQGEAYKAGMGELKKTLGGEFYDPRKSDFWKGFRDRSEMEQEKGVSDIRRRGQLGGGLYATPNQRTEAGFIRGKGADRTMMLGGLYEKERDRRTNAVGQALGYAGFGEKSILNRLTAGSTIGAIPRNIEDRRNLATFTQKSGQSEADYVQQRLRNKSAFDKTFGQSKADYTQQRLGNLATFTQKSDQVDADYASAMSEIVFQSNAATELMPQWHVDNTQPADPLGGILGIIGSIISK